MTQIVADFESVAAAVRRLSDMGETPTAQKVIAFVGGSKTTVLRHMRTLAANIASGEGMPDELGAYVTDMIRPVVARVVAEARLRAREESEQRLQLLSEIQVGISVSLDKLTEDLHAALARAEAAEAELAKLENAMDERIEMEQHLLALSEAVRALKGRPDGSATRMAVKLVQELDHAPDRKELHRRMSSLGFSDRESYAGRYHAVHSKYLQEKGKSPRLYVTELGSAWLTAQEARLSTRDENFRAQAG